MLTPPLARLFQSKVMFLPKVILSYDEPPLSGQPCRYPEGGRLMEVKM